MLTSLRTAATITLALTSLAACQRANSDDPQPAVLTGQWLLAVSGGGITGKMEPVPAGTDLRLVLNPDSTYASYANGKLTETSTFRFRSQPGAIAGTTEQTLLLKSTNSPSGQPYYRACYITLLTGQELHLTTGGGCALNAEYRRVSGSLPTATR